MHRPFSSEWAAAFRDAIEADAAYRETATKWTWPVALVLDAAPELGYAEPVAVELALDRGRCHGAEIRPLETVTAPFVLRAPYATWKQVMLGERIAVQGSLTTLMLHARSAAALCACARAVPTLFPDEA